MSNLHGKVALITGASSGIGQATAIYFASLRPHGLMLTGRDGPNLECTNRSCVAAGLEQEKVVKFEGDLTDKSTVDRLVEQTIKVFGRLDILVNSAGIVVSGPVETCPMSAYDKVMDINCRSIVYLSQQFLPHIKSTRGNIVNVSSINGICSFANVAYYCMSKSALDQFTKCLALEMAPHHVRVNSVNPGVIVTNVHKRGGMDEERYKQFMEHSKTTHALGRVGEPLEVAKAIAFLASDDSSFTTGHLLSVDGGRGIITPR